MTVTIRDVAKAAGVSITTVSRALNGYTDVNLDTKRKVLEVAERLNYHPSQVARSLVMNRTRTIGLLISDFNREPGGQYFMFDVLAGIHERLAAVGYDLTLVSTTTAQQRLVSYLDLCTEKRFDGVIVMGIRLDDPYVHEVVEAPLPSVVIDLPLISKHCAYVMTDNVNGARFAVRHLVERGHRKIGFVNGHQQAAVSQERRRGWEAACREQKIPFEEDWVYDADFTLQGGIRGLIELRARHKDMTAIFFASDLMAIGALQHCREQGIQVPQDLALVGFDNIDLTQFVTPTVSTIGQPRYEMGTTATELLLGMLDENKLPEGRMMSPELIVRETS
ncbi:LacI family DNA-binding transcriptional regulator [Alicyclobacillus mengziensis]|uniref:LacI family DNA-binding transcriptional regulator n=1 Tax=Alicyclobacillus mengziensis TaxID=2931921 RepID=A0A9X7Z6T7_9BACL|nr:LacI family DNA-binding transcriptional regulator [Alicyclobacillus mengziensis]QSO46563.1 LacI family DNA-binding transcriptional regulator [Alicyclobacillus mengziensis]